MFSWWLTLHDFMNQHIIGNSKPRFCTFPLLLFPYDFFHVCLYHESSIHQDHLCFFFLMLTFIQLIPPLIHLYIYLLALAITLYFFISLQRLSCRLIRNRCSWACGYLECVCGRREQFPGQKGLREERGSKRKRWTQRYPEPPAPQTRRENGETCLQLIFHVKKKKERKDWINEKKKKHLRSLARDFCRIETRFLFR